MNDIYVPVTDQEPWDEMDEAGLELVSVAVAFVANPSLAAFRTGRDAARRFLDAQLATWTTWPGSPVSGLYYDSWRGPTRHSEEARQWAAGEVPESLEAAREDLDDAETHLCAAAVAYFDGDMFHPVLSPRVFDQFADRVRDYLNHSFALSAEICQWQADGGS